MLSRKTLITSIAVTTAIFTAAALVAVLLLPGITIAHAETEPGVIAPGSFLEIRTGIWGASITSVVVSEVKIRADGTREQARPLDGRLAEGLYVNEDGSNPLVPDAEYTVSLTGKKQSLSITGIKEEVFEQTHTFRTVTTPMMIVSSSTLTAKYDEPFRLEWNVPVKSFDYELPGIGSFAEIGEDGRSVTVRLNKFEQGREYSLKIYGAISSDGFAMKEPLTVVARTSPPLTAAFSPADGLSGAGIEARPTITFNEPVANPETAKEAVAVEPAVNGELRWKDASTLEFIPVSPWDDLADVTIYLKGGPDKLRGASGSYIEQDLAATFTTAAAKSIEVDISEQTMTLYENGVPIDTFLVTTGKPGDDTPLGDFTIYEKFTKLDMRGPDYFVPGVPWVMVFQGDYTVHGNYWATAFGQQSSRGCVGLPPDTAQRVFEWTPRGTPISIHE